MYSNKQNSNLLTALLLAHGVTDAVVCPGSRNAPIAHDLNEAQGMRCHPVTDERSAGFYALGMAVATGRPTVVCVTSGSAMLNVAPAVAEAMYRRVPLIVVTADRPAQWIGQLDGQTMPQGGAFGGMVKMSVTVDEPQDEEQRWMCLRDISNALMTASSGGWPVHINVPLREPLFDFSTTSLPKVARRTLITPTADLDSLRKEVKDMGGKCHRLMVVVGQLPKDSVNDATIRRLSAKAVVLGETLSCATLATSRLDETMRCVSHIYNKVYKDGKTTTQDNITAHADNNTTHADNADTHDSLTARLMPERIIYVGGTLVSKSARQWLRRTGVPSWVVTPESDDLHDPLMSADRYIVCRLSEIDSLLDCMATGLEQMEPDTGYMNAWRRLSRHCTNCIEDYEPVYSQMAAVKYMEEQLEDLDDNINMHYANSSAIRLANIYADHYVWCNRGINGIEGSLSAAAGCSVVTDDLTVCVIGDLSFFYDQNALWNTCLRGNLRIVLLNNSCGGIFRQLKGLDRSPAADTIVAARHATTAQGICTQNDIGYIRARDMDEMRLGMVELLTRKTARPLLLEVTTDAQTDAAALQGLYELMLHNVMTGNAPI